MKETLLKLYRWVFPSGKITVEYIYDNHTESCGPGVGRTLGGLDTPEAFAHWCRQDDEEHRKAMDKDIKRHEVVANRRLRRKRVASKVRRARYSCISHQ